MPDIKFKVIDLSLALAEELIRKNHPRNRRPRGNRISVYASDMASGLWRLTHDPIALDTDDKLIDGQQRVMARIEADEIATGRIEVPVVLATGVPSTSMVTVDCGATRNVADASRIMGDPLPHGEVTYASVARRMYEGLTKFHNVSIQVMLSFMQAHKDALNFTFECLCRQVAGVTTSGVRAVIARAWYRRNSRNRVREFAEALKTGLIGDKDSDLAAITLRNWLFTSLNARDANASRDQVDIYARTETALTAFIGNEPIKRIVGTKRELFPIPDDPSLEEEGSDVLKIQTA